MHLYGIAVNFAQEKKSSLHIPNSLLSLFSSPVNQLIFCVVIIRVLVLLRLVPLRDGPPLLRTVTPSCSISIAIARSLSTRNALTLSITLSYCTD